ncbi:MAG TPA: hypothetical protein VGG33_21485 [Polyangia bacterium]
MSMKQRLLTTFAAVVSLAVSASPALAQDVIPITKVTVTPARPAKSDVGRLRKALALGTLSDQEVEAQHPVYIVKAFARFQPGPAKVMFSIGETTFPVYGTFGGGVFVRLYDPAQVSALAGQPVKLARLGPKGEAPSVDPTTLQKVPAIPANGPTVMTTPPPRKSVDEVLKSND